VTSDVGSKGGRLEVQKHELSWLGLAQVTILALALTFFAGEVFRSVVRYLIIYHKTLNPSP
jgi:hypothetical protein